MHILEHMLKLQTFNFLERLVACDNLFTEKLFEDVLVESLYSNY